MPPRMRSLIRGSRLVNVFDRSFAALGRIKYALFWSPELRSEFTHVWQALTERRMLVSGWDLEPSQGGSPSKRYWQKVKAVAEAMRQCWNKAPDEEALASPGDGPL